MGGLGGGLLLVGREGPSPSYCIKKLLLVDEGYAFESGGCLLFPKHKEVVRKLRYKLF